MYNPASGRKFSPPGILRGSADLQVCFIDEQQA
jgi:hypothetical protein